MSAINIKTKGHNMALTTEQIDALIESARAALQTALDSPKPDYIIGSKTMNHASYIKVMREQLHELSGMQAEIPSEQSFQFDSDIKSNGDDDTELQGDENI